MTGGRLSRRTGCLIVGLLTAFLWLLIALAVITVLQMFEDNSDLAVGALDALGSHRDISHLDARAGRLIS